MFKRLVITSYTNLKYYCHNTLKYIYTIMQKLFIQYFWITSLHYIYESF